MWHYLFNPLSKLPYLTVAPQPCWLLTTLFPFRCWRRVVVALILSKMARRSEMGAFVFEQLDLHQNVQTASAGRSHERK